MTIHWFSGNVPVDLATFFVGSVLFGIFMGWGWRIANKVP